MIFNVWDYTVADPDKEITLRCPGCGQLGTFAGLTGVSDVLLPKQLRWPSVCLGQRRCPNTTCNAHVFFALQRGQLLVLYPPERLDFDSTGIPLPIASAIQEAITCYIHGCYMAAAMLVRRSLEELCHDKGITGPNLKVRIDSLGTTVSLPQGMVEALHDLRLLGNEAAHIESQDFMSVGKEETELAISLTKSALHLVYQHSILVDKLKARKR